MFVIFWPSLFSSMVPLVPEPLPDLGSKHVLISAGLHDPIVTSQETKASTAKNWSICVKYNPYNMVSIKGSLSVPQNVLKSISKNLPKNI